MKKYLLIVVTLFLTSFAYSQSDKEEIDLMQAAFGMDKKAVVAEFVKPSPAEKDAFWKLYDEYEVKRKELGKQRIELLKQYADKYLTMTGVDAEAWTKQVMQLQKKTDKLTADYYSKVLKMCIRDRIAYPVQPCNRRGADHPGSSRFARTKKRERGCTTPHGWEKPGIFI